MIFWGGGKGSVALSKKHKTNRDLRPLVIDREVLTH